MSRLSDPWPTKQHRSLRDVARTDELLAKACARQEKFTHAETSELGHLLKKAYKYNPPPAPREPEAA